MVNKSILMKPFHFLIYSLIIIINLFAFQNCTPPHIKLSRSGSVDFSSLYATCTAKDQKCETQFATGTCQSGTSTTTGTGTLFCSQSTCKAGTQPQNLTTSLTLCIPSANFLRIDYSGAQQVNLTTNKIYPLLVTNSSDQILNLQRSSLTAISGQCAANDKGFLLNQKVSPWTYLVNGVATNVVIGYNALNYSGPLASDMTGCTWNACVESTKGLSSCIKLIAGCVANSVNAAAPTCVVAGVNGQNICKSDGSAYRCVANGTTPTQPPTLPPIMPPTQPPVPTPTCTAATRPADASANQSCAALLGPDYAGVYVQTTRYTCQGTQWLGTATNNSAQACTSTCNPNTRPSDSAVAKSCASLNGSNYVGNYTETTNYFCQGTQWLPNTNNNASQVCTARQCAQPQPAARTTTTNCQTLGSIFTGTFTETVSYRCDTTNFQWLESSVNTSNQCQTSLTRLSSFAANNGVIEIPAGVNAFIDTNVDASQLIINGKLVCGPNQNYSLQAETILVNGALECGSETAPFTGKLNISLKRNGNIIPKTGRELNGTVFGPSDAEIETQRQNLAISSARTVNFRALLVTGSLKLFGVPKTTLARLAQTLNVSTNTIQLDRTPNWSVGDEIAIAPTSYESGEGEKFIITAINGSQITLNRPANYQHWGGAIETFNSHNSVFSLNQRAEVVNLTRNIKIESFDKLSTGENANQLQPDQESSEPGGHVMVHMRGQAQVSAVEFYKMGQAGIMGRYPFHWHNVGNGAGQFIKNSTVHESFQRCITVHGTNNTIVDNNVCFSFRGHGFFLEDGNETGNTITNNIGFNAKLPHLSKILLSSDNRAETVDLRFPAVSVFWISNPQNVVNNNIAAGSVGTGFWNSFESDVLKLSTLSFNNNTAHSTLVGQTWDGARQPLQNSRNPNNHSDRKIDMAHYSPATVPVFNGMIAYKNRDAGMYFRGNTVIYERALMADNGWSFFMAFNQKVRNSVIVGKSANVTALSKRHSGVILYDGPFELENIDFYNFNDQSSNAVVTSDLSPMPFYVIGGTEKLTNISSNLRFLPQVTYKILLEKYVADPWVDKHISQSIRDLDGSFAGVPGGLILPNESFTTGPGCTAQTALIGMQVCPANTEIGKFFITSSNYGNGGTMFPFYMRRNDGAISLTPGELNMVGTGLAPLNDKMTLIYSPAFKYELNFTLDYTNRIKTSDVFLQYYNEKGPGISPIVKVVGYGSRCRLDSGIAVNSLAELAGVNQNSYFSSGGSTFVRIYANMLYHPIAGGLSLSREHTGSSRISCDAAYNPAADVISFDSVPVLPPANFPKGGQLKGYFDRVDSDGTVHGWACVLGSSYQIDVHVYAGGRAGAGGVMVGSTTANSASENAVSQICEDPSMKGHRFSFKPQLSVPASDYQGKSIWVHGINEADNSPIMGSGQFFFP